MDFISAPIIIILCYIFGEFYKIIVKKDENKYKYIPIIVGIFGGILGIICFYIDKTMIINAKNIIEAFTFGVINGLASTGSNQIIKQINSKVEKE